VNFAVGGGFFHVTVGKQNPFTVEGDVRLLKTARAESASGQLTAFHGLARSLQHEHSTSRLSTIAGVLGELVAEGAGHLLDKRDGAGLSQGVGQKDPAAELMDLSPKVFSGGAFALALTGQVIEIPVKSSPGSG
jgi:hypothetical protein